MSQIVKIRREAVQVETLKNVRLSQKTMLLALAGTNQDITKYEVYKRFSLQDACNLNILINESWKKEYDKNEIEMLKKHYQTCHLLNLENGSFKLTDYARMLTIEYLIAYAYINIRLKSSDVALLTSGIEYNSLSLQKNYLERIGIISLDNDDDEFIMKLAANIYYSFYKAYHIESKKRFKKRNNLYAFLDKMKFWTNTNEIRDLDLASELAVAGILDTLVTSEGIYFRLSGIGQSYVVANYNTILYKEVHKRQHIKQPVCFVYD